MPTGHKGEAPRRRERAPRVSEAAGGLRDDKAEHRDMAWSACPQSAQGYGRAGQELQRRDLEGGEGVATSADAG